MRILVINSRYYYVGGPERYLFNLKELLESHGHEVIPFSLKNSANISTPYEPYFPSALSDNQSTYFKDQNWNARSVVRTLKANFYSSEVESALEKLIADTRPDFAIVLLFLRKLSPAVLQVLSRMKVPFAVRLSDFGLICAGTTLFRSGTVCELCTKGSTYHSVIHKCVQHSYGASLVNWLATSYHQQRGYFDLVEKFLVPSRFLMSKLIDAGYDSTRFVHLPTFAYPVVRPSVVREQNRILYSGRLERGKGIHLLLQAMLMANGRGRTDLRLILAGNGEDEYIKDLMAFIDQNHLNNVSYLGNITNKATLYEEYCKASLTVIPSLYYDNMPNSAIESLSCGTPVVSPDFGCFPEFVISEKTGILYPQGSVEGLLDAILRILDDDALRLSMESTSIEYVKKHHSPEAHYDYLKKVMEEMVSGV